MAESTSASLFRVWNKLQETLLSLVSSNRPFVAPQLEKLHDMVYEVHTPLPGEKPQLEVVFLHGLQLKHDKDVYVRTWMSRDDSQLWLKTWLVESFPKARIVIVSYDASTRKTDESGRMDMYCTTENLVHALTSDEVRIGQAGCPIVLVGHCLGGLLLKELCISAKRMVEQNTAETLGSHRIHDLFSNLRGMFFYKTPHNGSLLRDGLESDIEGTLVDDIKTLKASSARRNEQFDKLKSRWRWYTYGLCELRETYVRIHVVPEASARSSMDNFYSVDADHDVCKPDKKEASSFTCLRNFLNQIQEVGVCKVGAMVDPGISSGYVDLGGRVNEVCSMLSGQETDTVFITGLSGIGKTALAQQIFHSIGHKFQVTRFVSLDSMEQATSNFREQILRKIVEAIDPWNTISSHNISGLLYYLKGRKVLFVVDNVESQDQLDVLYSLDIWGQRTANKLIVTTTNAQLGTQSNSSVVRLLSPKESHQLFCDYAFKGGGGPQNDLKHLLSAVIDECGNFPLFLRLLGAYVSKGNVHHRQLWLDLLERLEKAQEVYTGRDNRLWAKLRVCYDILPPPEKEIFLDIATFFNGFPISVVEFIWKRSRESPHIAWMNLKQVFLGSVDNDGNIWMHSHLRNLGKSIASPRDTIVAKWKRICSAPCAKELISEHQGIVDTVTLQLRIPEGESILLEKPTFLNFVYLQYLILEGVQTTSLTVDLPRSLVYLRWTNGVFKVCPVGFTCLENLVAVQLGDCKCMESLSPTVVCATKLVWLELDGCLSLKKLPKGLSKCLQHLSLKDTAVRELPSDLRRLNELTHLTVRSPHLTGIPERLWYLKMLSSLTVDSIGVTTLPDAIGNLRGLRTLSLNGTSLTSLPDSIGRLQELRCLDLKDSGMLSSLPESIGSLRDLTELYLDRTGLACLPETTGQLQILCTLGLSDTLVKGLPQSIGDLAKLTSLFLNRTPLETLPNSICKLHSLETLWLKGTQIGTIPGGIGELVNLQEFAFSSSNLEAWPKTFGQLSDLRRLTIDIGPLANLQVSGFYSQEAGGQDEGSALGIESLLSQLPSLRGVSELDLLGRRFPQSGMLPLFRALHLMPSLKALVLKDFDLVETIPHELGTLSRLIWLAVNGWETLVELPESLGELRMLASLDLQDNRRLNRLPESLSSLTSLVILDLRGCGTLQSMPRSFGRVSSCEVESSSSQGSTYTASETLQHSTTHSAPPDPPEPPPLVYLDSWRLAKCFLECPWKHLARSTTFWCGCKEMGKLRRKAVWNEGQGYVVDSKVAMQLLGERDAILGGCHDGLQEISRLSYHSSGHSCAPHIFIEILCDRQDLCRLHRGVPVLVIDLSEETEENIEGEDNIMDSNEEVDGDSVKEDTK